MKSHRDPSPTSDNALLPSHRSECYRCFRAASVCICDQVPLIANRTEVLVLQHHREVQHPIGTARIAKLGLKRVHVEVARRHGNLQMAATVQPQAALLFPHPAARDLSELPLSEYPRQLIVLDGTWSQANAMYRANSWLQPLPHLVLKPRHPSNYRIRRQPRAGCLSTIEALVQALQVIEPETEGLEQLLQVFDTMVDQQLAHMQD